MLSAGLLYLTQIVLARWMGGSEYGIYVAVWTWVLLLGGMSHFGLNMASMRLAPTYRETGDVGHLRGLIRGFRLTALGGGTVVMVLGLAGVWLLQDHIHGHFGMIGGAIATAMSLTAAALTNAVVVSRRLGIDVAIWKNLPKA